MYLSPSPTKMIWSGTPLWPESRCASAERTWYTDKRIVTTSRMLGQAAVSWDTKVFVSRNAAMPVWRSLIRAICSSMSACTEGCITEKLGGISGGATYLHALQLGPAWELEPVVGTELHQGHVVQELAER